MARQSEFITFLVEQLAGLGDVTTRAMFGGHSFFLDGRIFALVARDTLYVKADDLSRAEFESAGLQAFRPNPDKPESVMPYYTLPEGAIDDREALCAWAQKGVEVSARAATKKRTKPRRP